MKKNIKNNLLALVLTLVFTLSLTACTPKIIINTGDTDENTNQSETSVVASQPTAESSQKVETADPKADTKTDNTQSATTKKEKTASSKKSSTDTSSENTSSKSSSTISKSKAKSIALNHAEIKSKDITHYRIELDYDDGISKYEISFYVNGKEYEYDINAKTGKILSYEKPKTTLSDAKISKAKAKSIALKNAGVKASDVYDYELETDIENGVIKYEISFKANGYEYDYEINAKGGNIIKKEKERDD